MIASTRSKALNEKPCSAVSGICVISVHTCTSASDNKRPISVGAIKVFLDFGYPFFQAAYVSTAILIYLLSFGTKGSTKNKILLIVLALVWQFICDYAFLYQASRGMLILNGVNDYMYLFSYVLMSLAILQFRHKS